MFLLVEDARSPDLMLSQNDPRILMDDVNYVTMPNGLCFSAENPDTVVWGHLGKDMKVTSRSQCVS